MKNECHELNAKSSINPSSGFTLIEMLVSVGLFTSVITVALMALLNIKALQAKSTALRTINNNLNFAVELMSREIRTGKDYCINGNNCGVNSFEFTNDDDNKVRYAYDSNAKSITRSEDGGQALVITAPEVTITNLTFVTSGTEVGDSIQPMLTIIVNGETNSEKTNLNSDLNIQTTVSKREMDS